jgi:uncharacterized membrane protein
MGKEKEKFAEGICIKKAFWVFLVGCVFGVVMETILSYFQFGSFQSRKGLIYGPFNPVYGFGAVIFMVFLARVKNPLKVFVGGMLLGGGFEYICSLFQEELFGTYSWNYSKQAFNFNGRTSLYLMFWWGVIALVFIFKIYPKVSKEIEKIPKHIGNLLTVFLAIFMLVDCAISVSACYREKERSEGLKAENKVEVFLDKTYPDSRLNKIYVNMRREKS